MTQLDTIDRKIIELLTKDARMSMAEIARKVQFVSGCGKRTC